jgi:hypothetical protein
MRTPRRGLQWYAALKCRPRVLLMCLLGISVPHWHPSSCCTALPMLSTTWIASAWTHNGSHGANAHAGTALVSVHPDSGTVRVTDTTNVSLPRALLYHRFADAPLLTFLHSMCGPEKVLYLWTPGIRTPLSLKVIGLPSVPSACDSTQGPGTAMLLETSEHATNALIAYGPTTVETISNTGMAGPSAHGVGPEAGSDHMYARGSWDAGASNEVLSGVALDEAEHITPPLDGPASPAAGSETGASRSRKMSRDVGSVVASEVVQREGGKQAAEEEPFSWDALQAVREQLEAMCCGDGDFDDAVFKASADALVDTAALSLGMAAESAAPEQSAVADGQAVAHLADSVATEVHRCELTQGLSAAHAESEPECLSEDARPLSAPWLTFARPAIKVDGEAGGPSGQDSAATKSSDEARRRRGATLQVCGLAGQSSLSRPEDGTVFSLNATTVYTPAPEAGPALISFSDSEHMPPSAAPTVQPQIQTNVRSLIDCDFDASPPVGGPLPSSSSTTNPPCSDGSISWLSGDKGPDTAAGEEPGELRCSVTLLPVPIAAEVKPLSNCGHESNSAMQLPRQQCPREAAKAVEANEASAEALAIGQPQATKIAPPRRSRATGGIAWAIETRRTEPLPISLSTGPCRKAHCVPEGTREPQRKALSSAAVLRRLMRKKPTVRQLLGKSPPTPVPVYEVRTAMPYALCLPR